MTIRTEINKIVAIKKDGTLIMAREFFRHDGSFYGVTGAEFVPLTKEQVEERQTVEYIDDCYDGDWLWSEYKDNRNASFKSKEEYLEYLCEEGQQGDSVFFGHDSSYVHNIPNKFFEQLNAETFECVSGGRIFPRCMQDEEFADILEPELLESIMEIEAK